MRSSLMTCAPGTRARTPPCCRPARRGRRRCSGRRRRPRTARSPAPAAGEHLQPGVLQLVGVLELVDQDVAEAPLVVLAQRGRCRASARRCAASARRSRPRPRAGTARRRPRRPRPCTRLCSSRTSMSLARRPSSLAPAIDQVTCLGTWRSSSRFIAFITPLDRRELVLRVEDLEALRQGGQLPVRAQEAVAQAVEGADPHAAHRDRQHRVEPRQHLLGRLVGEGDGQHAARRELAGLDQPGDAGGEDAGLAGAGAGEDQRRLGPAG